MGSTAVNGIAIGFDDEGGGTAPPLLLVHGHPFDRTMWRPQLAVLARADQRMLAPDLRGYGESAVMPGKTTFDVFARDLAAFLDDRGAGGSVVLCGLSMGGQIVMEFCRLFPERVAGLVLAATLPQKETEAGRRSRNAMADRLLREGLAGYAEEVLPRMLSPSSIKALPAVAQQVLEMMRRAHPEGAAAALRGRAERPDYEAVLAGLGVPALVVVGEHDAFTTRADALRMQALLKGSELLWLEGVGHLPNLERAQDFNAALERLLEAVRVTA